MVQETDRRSVHTAASTNTYHLDLAEELPEREYRVASQIKQSKDYKYQRSRRLIFLGVLIFLSGFLLGKAAAIAISDGSSNSGNSRWQINLSQDPSTEPVQVLNLSDGNPDSDWMLTLVNRTHSLPETFQISDLTQLRNRQAVDSRAYPELQAMMDAARAEGLQPLICSSFRTWETQTRLYQNKIQRLQDTGYSRKEAEQEAAVWVAPPGTSEHQLGLALDIVDKNYQLLDEKQENTAVQKWLMAHCAEYGFILRYPTDKSEITGIGYEPWHYRYVGQEAAKEIMSQGICLEEYLQQK